MKKFPFRSSRFVALLTVLAFVPVNVFAETQVTGAFQSLGGVVDSFTKYVVGAVGSLMLALGTVAFFYGMVQYIWGRREGDAAKTKVGNSFMLWGLVGMFVLFSVWGIISYFQTVFQLDKNAKVYMPWGTPLGGLGSNSNQAMGSQSPAATALPSGQTVNSGAGTPSTNSFGDYLRNLGGGGGSGSGPASGATQASQSSGGSSAANSVYNYSNDIRGPAATYTCSPGYECTLLSGGGIGLCNSAGNACEPYQSPSGGSADTTKDCGFYFTYDPSTDSCVSN